MGRNSRASHAVGIVMVLGICSGCDQPEAPTPPTKLGLLPYLQQTHHPQLRAELDRLLADQATPAQLERTGTAQHSDTVASRSADDGNDALSKILAPQALRLTRQRVQRCYPEGDFQFDPLALEGAREVRQQFSPQLQQYRTVLRRDDFRFHISLRDGLLADLSVLDHAEVAHRLEAFEVAELLAAGDLPQALLPLRNMLLIDSRLSWVQHVTARLAAARLRAEALDVIAAVVKHPKCRRDLQGALLEILAAQLAAWPSDARAWIGDRALGLHAYEMVRDGQLLSILTQQELQSLQEEKKLASFTKALLSSLDEDEWFYLASMRRLIACCEEPFFQRAATLQEINDEIDRLRDTPHYPLFAANVLLRSVATGQREQALDRVRCEAWVIALTVATLGNVDPIPVNPITGEPYELEREFEAVEVKVIGGSSGETLVVVPLLRPM